jgi:hypothetical protein
MDTRHETTEAPEQAAGPSPMDLETARAVLAAEEERNKQACAAEIQQVLEKYGYSLDVTKPQIVLT